MRKVDVSRDEPSERLGRIAARMFEALEGDPERLDERAVVILTEAREGGKCVTALHGYEGEDAPLDAFLDLYQHLEAIAATMGKSLQLLPIEPKGQE